MWRGGCREPKRKRESKVRAESIPLQRVWLWRENRTEMVGWLEEDKMLQELCTPVCLAKMGELWQYLWEKQRSWRKERRRVVEPPRALDPECRRKK